MNEAQTWWWRVFDALKSESGVWAHTIALSAEDGRLPHPDTLARFTLARCEAAAWWRERGDVEPLVRR